MSEQIYVDVFAEEIVLTDEVLAETFYKHPEAKDFIELIETTLKAPDEVRRSSSDDRVMLYDRYASNVLSGKWIVVVVKHIDRNYVSTFYATSKVKVGDVLWKK